MNNYDVIVVGSGFAGSILARFFAEHKKKVLLCEKRDHIAGNMYDFVNKDGIRIQKYGPHIFHTNNERVYKYISKYEVIEPYSLKCSTQIMNKETPVPFSFKTIDQFYEFDKAIELKEKLIKKYPKKCASILQLLNDSDEDINTYANFLFENDYKPYTAKQWGVEPENIDPYVLRRVPVIFDYRENYFNEKYEGLPKNGYSSLFEKILCHNNIITKTNFDALEHISFNDDKVLFDGIEKNIVYTGPIDELFNNRFGMLPYRSLLFEFETLDCESYQNNAIVTFPKSNRYTRITEYTKLPYQKNRRTIIAKEYPLNYKKNNKEGSEPYYPIVTKESTEIYKRYLEYSKKFSNLILCGRLAEFKYYNMDAVIDRALELCDILERTYNAKI